MASAVVSSNPHPSPPSVSVPFDLDAEKALVDKLLIKVEDHRARHDILEQEDTKVGIALTANERTLKKLKRQMLRIESNIVENKNRQWNLEMAKNRCKDDIEKGEAAIAMARTRITLNATLSLVRLRSDEIKIMVLRFAFLKEEPIEIQSFSQFADYVLHPMCQESSGVQNLARQIIFGENKFLISNSEVASQVLTAKLPKPAKEWLKNLCIPWGPHSFYMTTPLIACERLANLELCLDFSKVKLSNPDSLIKAPGTRKLLERLSNSCRVTITNSVDGPISWRGYQYADQDTQVNLCADMQIFFDSRPKFPFDFA